jgi:hypothetical protein
VNTYCWYTMMYLDKKHITSFFREYTFFLSIGVHNNHITHVFGVDICLNGQHIIPKKDRDMSIGWPRVLVPCLFCFLFILSPILCPFFSNPLPPPLTPLTRPPPPAAPPAPQHPPPNARHPLPPPPPPPNTPPHPTPPTH